MNEPILSPPSKPYEAYPGCPLSTFANDFLNGKPITLQAFCKNERIDPHELPRLISEVLTEWSLTEPAHASYRDAASHLINHIRIKNRNEQRNSHTAGRQPSCGDAAGADRTHGVARAILERIAARKNQ